MAVCTPFRRPGGAAVVAATGTQAVAAVAVVAAAVAAAIQPTSEVAATQPTPEARRNFARADNWPLSARTGGAVRQ